jgi:outer membrane cobalamin receptor
MFGITPRTIKPLPLCLATVLLILGIAEPQETSASKEKTKDPKEQESRIQITEEILVVGKAPREAPLSTVTTVGAETVTLMRPRDLVDVVRHAVGAMVSVGSKEEYNLKLRGIDSRRIALLVDGVPVSEPYYGNFDIKTVSAGGIQTLQVTKGPSSVLYGPNTLGGIVNVITRRPSAKPTLTLNASTGNRKTQALGLDSTFTWRDWGFSGSALYQDSDGFDYVDDNGELVPRTNTYYRRLNLGAKVYYNPSERTEIMASVGSYRSDYDMPPDLFGRARYWKFKDWNRTSLSAGGFTALGERSTLRFRAYAVNYFNILEQFRDAQMTRRQFESTFDNSNAGLFALADLFLSDRHSLKASIYAQRDVARQQDDVGLPWIEFSQEVYSAGLEDHFRLSEKWQIIGGLSLDSLHKDTGGAVTKVNPLIGLKFYPIDDMDLRFSFSGKSRFPNMRSLYSLSSGNPDLLSEYGQCWELGFTYNRGVFLSGAVFANSLRNLIDSRRLLDGSRRYFNIGEARINGFEIQVQKDWNIVRTTVNYTYLDHRNETDDRPLDVTPAHSANFELAFEPLRNLRAGIFGVYNSKTNWYDFNAQKLLEIPSFVSMDVVVSLKAGPVEPFLRVTNLFNKAFYTEPGFPWRGRFIEAGVRAGIF